MNDESKNSMQQDFASTDDFNTNFETIKNRIANTLIEPILDEVDKLKQEIEFKTRALKQKEAEAVHSQLESIDQTKNYYNELLK